MPTSNQIHVSLISFLGGQSSRLLCDRRIGPRRTSSNALEMIFTKYKVSPHFLDTFGSEYRLNEIGGLGVGVRSKLLFSEVEPREVRGYREFNVSAVVCPIHVLTHRRSLV
jgi:hypothetical protein